jgi:catechol 2,3-dioxygenase-like lactoylglutathione lyase family enzyme
LASALDVERVDFVTVPTRDMERSRGFYHETLGLPLDSSNPREVTAGQVTLAFWEPESDGVEFSPNVGGIALRVNDVAAARAELEAKGVEFLGTDDSGVCHMAYFHDPDGNTVILHRRYAPYA